MRRAPAGRHAFPGYLHLPYAALWGALYALFGPNLGLGAAWGGVTLALVLFLAEALLWRPRAGLSDYSLRALAVPLLAWTAAGLATVLLTAALGVRFQ